MFDKLIPTTLVGSYPQPDWLVDKDKLLGSGPPRVRMREVWRVPEALLEEAQDDGTLTALHDQERAGINLGTEDVETPELIAERLRGALKHISPDRLIAAPDCGMKYLQRDVAFGKLQAMVEGATIVRNEITGKG